MGFSFPLRMTISVRLTMPPAQNTLPPEPAPGSGEIAFTKLFVANERAIYGFIYSLTQNRGAAEDLRQELAERLWVKFADYDPQRPFVAWAIGFARLLVFEWRRKEAKLPIPIGDEALGKLADAAAERAENHEEIRAALHECAEGLTGLQRKALHERYYNEQPVALIAKAWGRTEMAVYKLLKRVQQNMADCLRLKLDRPPVP